MPNTKGLYLRPDSPYWWYSFQLPGQTQVCRSTKTTDRKTAVIIYQRERTKSFERKEFNKPLQITVEALLARCSKHHWSENRTEKELKKITSILKSVIEKLGGDRADQLTKDRLRDYRKERLLSVKKSSGKSIKKSTVNKEMTLLRAAFYWAIGEKMLNSNPVADLDFYDETEFRRTRYFTQQQKDKILNDAQGQLKDIVLFALKTGLRLGEIIKLKWTSVNFEANTVSVLSKKGKKPLLRHVPLFLQARQCLENQPHRSDYVFSRPNGKMLDPSVVYHQFVRLLNKMEIDGFTFHDLRHTLASDFLMRGGSIAGLSKILGHSTTTMTERYGHLSKEHLGAAIALLPEEKSYESIRGEMYYDSTTLQKVENEKIAEMAVNQ